MTRMKTHWATAIEQIEQERRLVNFDVAEWTAELLVIKLTRKEIRIPHYQRSMVWDEERQSTFVESVILGLPIPYMFMADVGGELEMVDGSQRIRTLHSFVHDGLELRELEILSALNGFTFSDLPPEEQRRFNNRTLRAMVLSSNASLSTRFEVFSRINSGAVTLTAAEFRRGAYPGPFYDLVCDCAQDATFSVICPVGPSRDARGEREELVLRFFAYGETYQTFTHDVTRFLNHFLESKRDEAAQGVARYRLNFDRMVEFVSTNFPSGMRKSRTAKSVPRVRFEAIAVGVHLALEAQPNAVPKSVAWLDSQEFTRLTTTHASNSGPRLTARIEYVRDNILG